MKPKLLITADQFLPRWDGIIRFMLEVAPRLAKRYDVTLMVPSVGNIKKRFPFRLVEIPARKKVIGDLKLAKFRPFKIAKEVKNCDILFSQSEATIGLLAIHYAKRYKKPIVQYVHAIEWELVPRAVRNLGIKKLLYPLTKSFIRHLYNKCDIILTPSEGISEMLTWERIKPRKLVVHLGVDSKKFRPGKNLELRKKLGIKKDDIVIGQHGRLAREKDLKTLLRAFVRLRVKYSNLKMLVVAKGLVEIEDMLSREGIILPGAQEKVEDYLRVMDIFTLTSLVETTSLATLEAMATSLPVVATRVGFVKDYLEEGLSGFFFPFRDSYILAKCLEKLITNPTLRKRMGEKARRVVEKKFTWERTVEGIIAALESVENKDL
jgi:glycosyltransferase involved in cell wall biosynthesis